MRTTWRRPILAAVTCLALAVPIVAAVTPAVAADASSMRINEVESDGGVPGDWVELVNTGTAPEDVSGYVVMDADAGHKLVIPAGTVVAPGGFLVVDTDADATTGFGLGKADSARLFAADGTTPIDSYSWTAHAVGTTYGRYPDGSGPWATTAGSTRGAANSEPAPVVPVTPPVTPPVTQPTTGALRINEVESNGGTPGDWVELFNSGTSAVDIGGYVFRDNSDEAAHRYAIPAGTSVAAGGYYLLEEAAFGYGLGAPDSARLFAPDGSTVVDSRSWTAHAVPTLGYCGTAFVVTTASTKGAANDCSAPVRINEIESNDGENADWIELKNNGTGAVDLAGYVLKDSAEKTPYVFPSGSTLAAGGYVVVTPQFGLGGGDQVRLLAPDATTLVDSYVWAAHAATTYGRCPDGVGAFATTKAATKGATNSCAGDLVTTPWPGSNTVNYADVQNTYPSNLSGLAYETATGGDVLWAVKNGPGTLYRLADDGTNWVSGSAGGWGAGKVLHYADGTGDVDAEGVAVTAAGAAGGVFVSSERNNSAGSVSRPSVLRYDVASAGSSLKAAMEWNLTADLPAVGANLGLEAIAWVPDSFLVAEGMLDERTQARYTPSSYADHGSGLFFVGLEGGGVYAFALNQVTGGYSRVATIATGLAGVMDLEFEAETGALWAVCDDTCSGRSAQLEIGATGLFAPARVVERPTGMPNINNEGFAMAPQARCASGSKSVFWADDASTDGHALREGSIACTTVAPPVAPTTPITPVPAPGAPAAPATVGASTPVPAAALTALARGTVDAPSRATAGATITLTVGRAHAGETVNVWMYSTPVLLGSYTVSATGTVRVVVPAGAPAGAHRLAVLADDGTLIGWDTITVADVRSGRLAATGVDLGAPVGGALMLLLAGAGMLVMRRGRARVGS